MTSTSKAPVLVVLQLTGGNDYLNTVIPYTNPLYRDYRPVVGIPEDKVLPLDDTAAFHPAMGPMKPIYERGDMAIIHGVGYPNAPRSHFRSMDIWHTCEPNKLGTEGWLGRATREIDPHKENVLTTVSFGPSLFRALTLPGVPVACVDNLDNYGLLPGVSEQRQRTPHSGVVCAYVLPGYRQRPGHGLPGPDRSGHLAGCRYPEECAQDVLFDRASTRKRPSPRS